MNTGGFVLQFLLSMLLVDKAWTYGYKPENCSICISVPRNTTYYADLGDSITIVCPVKYCQEQPVMNWYMYNQENKEFLMLHHGQRHTVSWTNEKDYILTFPSISKNDSGQYRCEASVGKTKIPGHAIKVIIKDLDNRTLLEDAHNSTNAHRESEKSEMLTIYTLSSLGAVGLLTVCCFILLHFTHKCKEKDKKASSASQSEMNVINSCKDTQCCNENTIQGFLQEPTPHSLLFLKDNVIYGNESNCWKAKKTVAKPTQDQSVTNQFSPANQDGPVYATLSHGEIFQRSEPSKETEFTEYASIVTIN